jgi:hypothetical protein
LDWYLLCQYEIIEQLPFSCSPDMIEAATHMFSIFDFVCHDTTNLATESPRSQAYREFMLDSFQDYAYTSCAL